jgi:hypothetical protein
MRQGRQQTGQEREILLTQELPSLSGAMKVVLMAVALLVALSSAAVIFADNVFAQSRYGCLGRHGAIIPQRCINRTAPPPSTCSDVRRLCLGNGRATAAMCAERHRQCLQSGCWLGPRINACGFDRT